MFNTELQINFPMLKKGKYDSEGVLYQLIFRLHTRVLQTNEHLSKQKHKTNLKNQANSSNIVTYFVKSISEDLLIRAAKDTFVNHTVGHHMSFMSCFGLHLCSQSQNIFGF